jgi:hypothetical protein
MQLKKIEEFYKSGESEFNYWLNDQLVNHTMNFRYRIYLFFRYRLKILEIT